MSGKSINLSGLTLLIADPNAYFRTITQRILRGFGAGNVLEAGNAELALQVMAERRIDILLCDIQLPPDGGLKLVRSIRSDPKNEHRTVPILVLSSDTRPVTVQRARDSGANMVLVKPLSPRNLYDRLAWVALTPRNFVEHETYFGPDRRFKIEGFPDGVGRRKGDQAVEVGESSGPALSQNEIDNLLNFARKG